MHLLRAPERPGAMGNNNRRFIRCSGWNWWCGAAQDAGRLELGRDITPRLPAAQGFGCEIFCRTSFRLWVQLRQCLGMIRYPALDKAVRADLIRQFGSSPGRERVGVGTYLELEYHWEAVLVGIMKHSWEHKGNVHPNVVENFCIKGLI